jgi:hypothetical protein
MAVTIYRSSDAGAPACDFESLNGWQTLMDAILVNGYGSKPAAGWTKPFTPSATAVVYLNGATAKARSYFRVLSGGNDAFEGYHAMTDADTGTQPFGKIGSSLWSTNRLTYLDITATSWLAVADERTLFFRYYNGSNQRYLGFYWGDFVSLTDPDEGCAMILTADISSGSVPYGSPWLGGNKTSHPGQNKSAIKGYPTYNGIELFGLNYPQPMVVDQGDSFYKTPVSAVDNRFYCAPLWVCHADNNSFTNPVLRGRLRWLHVCLGPDTLYTDDTTVPGMGQLAGKTLTLLKLAHPNVGLVQHFFVAVDTQD